MARPEKNDPGFLLDMLLAARDAVDFVSGLDKMAFEKSKLHQAAVMRCIEVIGGSRPPVQGGTSRHSVRALAGRDRHASQADP